MTVRLRIRGKLVLSFSVVMIMVLSGLGYITYLTFADSIHSHKEEIASLKLEAIGLNVNQSIAANESAFKDAVIHLAAAKGDLSGLELGSFAGVGLVDGNRQWIASAGSADAAAEIRSLHGRGAIRSPGVFLGAASVIFTSTNISTGGGATRVLFASAPYSSIFGQVLGQTTSDHAEILITRGDRLISNGDSRLLGAQFFVEHRADDSYAETLRKIGNVYVMRKSLPALDIDVWYALDEKHYLEAIIELKNRVIAATVIILWVSIWIVLIIAYRIAKPIRALTDATKEMQQAEYSAPLNYARSGDEVGDLGERFEEMRLHIEGLISKDPLSGLFNRRYLMHSLRIEVAKAKRGGQPLCCLMLDLDHFKRINDTYGHQCGDEVIKRTAKIIQNSLRNYDICARYGGEEFVVILPMTTIQDARIVAERIRATVERSPFEWEGKTISATVSIGASIYRREDDESDHGEHMIGNADEALYEAKKSGRNRVMGGERVASPMVAVG